MTNLHPVMASILKAHGAPASKPAIHEDVAEAIEHALAYFGNRADVSDGDYGVPEPNEEMRIADMLRNALVKLEG
jgi:hypothetical protein